MLISIDGQEHPELVGQDRTLGQVLGDVKEVLSDSGRMIVAIECDGKSLSTEQVEESMTEPADTYWQVNFQTTRPEHLAGEALEVTNGLLDQIDTLTASTAELLSQSQIKEAMEHMGRLCILWNQAYQGVYNTLKLLNVDPAGIELATGTASGTMDRLLDQLREVKSCLENQDYTQLADILSYELAPLVNDWRGIAKALVDGLEDAQD